MLATVPLIQLDDYKLQQLQQNLVTFLNQLGQIQIIDGTLLEGVQLSSATTTTIPHKLKRNYVGYFITKLNANAVIWVGDTTESDAFLKLSASANCTVDIWVF